MEQTKQAHEMNYVEKIAAAAGCSPRYVKMILNGERGQNSKLSERVLVASTLIPEKENLLLQEVKEAVKF